MPPEIAAQTQTTPADKPLLLIVDDSRLMRHALKKILSDGYTLIEAEDGEGAWDKLRKTPGVQAVFTDLSMPGMDGFGLLKCIREADNAAIQSLPVIVITGNEDDTVVKEKALAAGASSFITKPFQSAQIKSCAEQYTCMQTTPGALPESVTGSIAGLSEVTVQQAAEEAARIEAEARAREQAANEMRAQAEAEARRRAEEEARMRLAEESRREAEAEAARLRAEEDARIRAEEERVRAEAEAKRAAEAEARRAADAEMERLSREAESARIRAALKAIQARDQAERVERYSLTAGLCIRLVLPFYAVVNRLCGRRFDRRIREMKDRL
jgi:CheY-like chemotaxis protein